MKTMLMILFSAFALSGISADQKITPEVQNAIDQARKKLAQSTQFFQTYKKLEGKFSYINTNAESLSLNILPENLRLILKKAEPYQACYIYRCYLSRDNGLLCGFLLKDNQFFIISEEHTPPLTFNPQNPECPEYAESAILESAEIHDDQKAYAHLENIYFFDITKLNFTRSAMPESLAKKIVKVLHILKNAKPTFSVSSDNFIHNFEDSLGYAFLSAPRDKGITLYGSDSQLWGFDFVHTFQSTLPLTKKINDALGPLCASPLIDINPDTSLDELPLIYTKTEKACDKIIQEYSPQ